MPKASLVDTPRRLNAAAASLLTGTPYIGYSYAYPHKTAYRLFDAPLPLQALWKNEDKQALFLYLHVPFCRMRCGFCNLLTTTSVGPDSMMQYLHALRSQATRVKAALGAGARFARIAIGGGTPAFLAPRELEQLFGIVREIGAEPGAAPTSIEVSPETVDEARLEVLKASGVSRISIGVQSFIEQEAADMGRPQRDTDVRRALDQIRATGIDTLNIDLIYGGAGQSEESWLFSLEKALSYEPEEIFLYPLYVRPLTGLGKLGWSWDEQRLALYRTGRDHLQARGYEQVSMRMFRKKRAAAACPEYCCQRDGMVGLGAGARSYTAGVHYSTEYAVQNAGVRSVIQDFVDQPEERHGYAHYGVLLSAEERKRRYLIQSLLQAQGMDLAEFKRMHGSAAEDDFPELRELRKSGLAQDAPGRAILSQAGLERSDAIGPWLYSQAMGRRMEEFAWK